MRSLLLLLVALMPATSATPPNVVFILADDLGYNEMGFMNGTRGLITPHLDALASSGVILKNYYVQPICSPTRSALLTGRYTIRLGTQSNVVFWDTPWGIALNETFLSQNLHDAGYRTAMFGKWHLGMYRKEFLPTSRGFDEHVGYMQGCQSAYTHVSACCAASSADHDIDFVCRGTSPKDYRGYDWFASGAYPNNGTSPDLSVNHSNSAVVIRNAAVDFLSRQRGQPSPFFLYLPFQNIHSPYTCDAKYRDMYANHTGLSSLEQTMFGYITEMDTMVGDIIAALKENGHYENSVIIFSSDNGAPPTGDSMDHEHGEYPGYIARNYPLRGHKGEIFEGGTRVPGFVHSPLLPSSRRGVVSEELYHVTDWLPTIVHLAQGKTSRNLPLDGHNIWGSVAHGEPSPRTEMLYGINPLKGGQAAFPKAALRVGDFKLLTWAYTVAGVENATATGPHPAPEETKCDPVFKRGPVLYNVKEDIAETTNLADDPKYADVVAKMLSRLHELASESVYPMSWSPPYQGPAYECASCPLHPSGSGPNVPWTPWL